MPNCTFQVKWLLDDRYKNWVVKDTNVHYAKCKLCNVRIYIGTMGTSALRSHSCGKKHQSKINQTCADGFSITELLPSQARSTAPTGTSSGGQTATPESQNVSHYVSKSDCLNAEVWHALYCVDIGASFSSNKHVSFVWQQQFTDSAIAKKATCGETKSMYLACYGIAPHFCHVLRKKQMDFMVRL